MPYALSEKYYKKIDHPVYKAHVTCPKCGFKANLSSHKVAENGIVTPSLICPRGGCTFHEWVVLENWNREE